MSERIASWSETKLDRWRSELPGFWAQDTWDMFASPEEALRLSVCTRESCRRLTFECASESVKTEIKYACYQKIRRGEWAFGAALYTHLRPFLQWVKETIPSSTSSLLERALSEWKISFLTYRAERGLMNERWSEQLLSTQVSKRYRSTYPAIGRLTQIYRLLEETYDERPEYEKDVWDLRKLGMAANGAHSRYTLNYYPRPLVVGSDGKPVESPDQRRQLRMEDQFDALLYLGPQSVITRAELSPSLCSDAAYLEMRLGRMALLGLQAGIDRLKQYCAAVPPK